MPVAGQAALSRVIRRLIGQGIHDIAINIHHFPDQIREQIGDGSKFNANIYYSYESRLLNSGGGVRTALELLPQGELVAVYNADIMADVPLKQLAALCPQAGCCLALVPNPEHNLAGDFSLEQHLVKNKADTTFTFSGVSVWHEEALKAFSPQQIFPLTQPIQTLIASEKCTGLVHRGKWFDIGRPRDLIQANRFFRHEGI